MEDIVVVFGAGIDLGNAINDLAERNATPKIAHGDGGSFDVDLDLLAEAHDVFVDGVVDDFLEKDVATVVEIRAVTDTADVHAGAEADVFEGRKRFDFALVIDVLFRVCHSQKLTGISGNPVFSAIRLLKKRNFAGLTGHLRIGTARARHYTGCQFERAPMKHSTLLAITFLVLLASGVVAAPETAVGISEDDDSFALTNDVIAAHFSKHSGDLTSLSYKGMEMLDGKSARGSAYWSHDVSRGQRQTRITIDPAANGGARGEVSILGISGGKAMGSGPGGSVIADIEIRYALARGDSGLYTYCVFSHPTNYPATSVGEARFCAKLNDSIFDWMTVDTNRNMEMITAYDWNHGTQMNMKEARRMNSGLYRGQVEHKYDYSGNQFDVRAWGWSSTAQHAPVFGLSIHRWNILSGGPTKVGLSAHRDATFNTPTPLTRPLPPPCSITGVGVITAAAFAPSHRARRGQKSSDHF